MFGHKDGHIAFLLTNVGITVKGIANEMEVALGKEGKEDELPKEKFVALMKHQLKRLKTAEDDLSKISGIERRIVAIFEEEFGK
jgi:hypothetical protein